MEKLQKLETALKEITTSENSLGVVKFEPRKGILGIGSEPGKIIIMAENIDDDIKFAGEVERLLRNEFGYGMLEKGYDAKTKKFEASYSLIDDFQPEKVIKSITLSGKSRTHYVVDSEPRRKRYSTPGTSSLKA